MKISIIVPAYNIAPHLPRCLDSLLAQEYENIEIIVVNDGSSDGTGTVADTYAQKDSRVRVIHKENGGVTSARLRGIAEATGDFIGFCDGDDYAEPDMFSRLINNAVAHGTAISHCGYQMVFPDGKIDYYYNSGKLILQKEKQGCTDLLSGAFVEPSLNNKLYRRNLFNGLEDWMYKEIRINEDLLMNFYLFRQADTAVFEDFCPYHYILSKDSATTSKLNAHKLDDPLRVLKIMEAETEGETEWSQIINGRIAYTLIGLSTIAYGDQKELIKSYRVAARKELRRRLKSIMSGRLSNKLKIMSLWAAVWPGSYSFVHRVYAKVTGIDKKYEVK